MGFDRGSWYLVLGANEGFLPVYPLYEELLIACFTTGRKRQLHHWIKEGALDSKVLGLLVRSTNTLRRPFTPLPHSTHQQYTLTFLSTN